MANGDGGELPADAGWTMPQVLALDTQVLVSERWPTIAPTLHELLELADNLDIPVWLPEAALLERRAQIKKETVAASTQVESALRNALRHDLTATGTPGNPDETMTRWDTASQAAIDKLGLQRVPLSKRTVDDLFRAAVNLVPPFKEKGVGFKDAAIVVSVADEMIRLRLDRCWIVSADGDFIQANQLAPTLFLKHSTLAEATARLRDQLTRQKGAAALELFRLESERQTLATTAIASVMNELEEFVRREFAIRPIDLGMSRLPLRILDLKVGRIVLLQLSPSFEDVAIGTSVQVSALLEVVVRAEVRRENPNRILRA